MHFIPLDFISDTNQTNEKNRIINMSVNLCQIKFYYEQQLLNLHNKVSNLKNLDTLREVYQNSIDEIDSYLKALRYFQFNPLNDDFNLVLEFYQYKTSEFENIEIDNFDEFRKWIYNGEFAFD
jgi:conjugal transfer/entry exclusion protein